MAKVISAIHAPGPGQRETFRKETLAIVFESLRALPGLQRLVVGLADVETTAGPERVRPRYDIVVQSWWTGEAPAIMPGLPQGSICHSFLVAEHVQLAPPSPVAVGVRPGVKAVYFVRRRDDLDDRQAKARWTSHADTARRHHAGMVEYVQNGVIRALDDGAPVVHGIAELHFPTLRDLEERLYDSPEGHRAVQADVDGLVAEAHPVYTTEHVLLA